jgi:hypothetical protein
MIPATNLGPKCPDMNPVNRILSSPSLLQQKESCENLPVKVSILVMVELSGQQWIVCG